LITHPALLASLAVIRLRVFLGTALALGAILGTLVHAQLTDEEKKKRDARKAREEMRAITSPTPSETPEPTSKPKPAKRKSKSKKKATPTPKPKAKAKPTETPEPTKTPRPKKNSDDEEESPTPKPKAKSSGKTTTGEDENVTPQPKAKNTGTPEPTKTPATKKSPKAEPEKSPSPKKKADSEKETPKPKRIEKAEPVKTPSPSTTPSKSKLDGLKPSSSQGPVESTRPPAAITPRPTLEPFRTPAAESPAVPRPAPRPTLRPPLPPTSLPSDITVEKSGLEQEQGFQPPPPPPPRRGFWPWSRQPTNYRYLTSANIEAIRRAPVQRARWKFVIVHNSGTRQGSARVFDYYHRHVRRMRNGLAYHFVIGNGTSTRNGQIEIGDRWVHQTRGGHVHSDYMNNIGLGICLVGDFNRDQPTRAQLEACEELIRYLQERCGKMAVRPHREVNPPRWATDCPGDAFPYGWFGRFR
jgi:hypothetical protein